MSIQRNVILTIIGICLLAISGCRAVLVAVPTGPPSHAPARVYHATHRYHYYPQEQVYFDPIRQVYFYPDGRNWRVVSTPPRWIQLSQSDYVVIDTDQDEPYREFERHRTMYPRRDHDARQPRAVTPPSDRSHHVKHLYHYYPEDQVYFDPGRKVFFYQDGRNWRMTAKMPKRMRFSQSDYVPIQTEHDAPYREFEKHRTMYPKKSHDARQPMMTTPEMEREGQRRESEERRNISHRRGLEERQPRELPPVMERGNSHRDDKDRSRYSQERPVERQPRIAPPETEREKSRREFDERSTMDPRGRRGERQPMVAAPEVERGNSQWDAKDGNRYQQGRQVERQPEVAIPERKRENSILDEMGRTGNTQERQIVRQPRMAPPEIESKKTDRKFEEHGTVDPKERHAEKDPKITDAEMEPEKAIREEEKKAMAFKHMDKKNNKKKNKNKKY